MANSCRAKLPFLLLVVARLILSGPLPMAALTDNGYDEALFIRQGMTVASGRWLGPYNHLTLIKGPGYPIFIAATYHIGIPLPLAQQLLYVLFCVVLAIALRPAIPDTAARLFVFAVLLFNPLGFDVGILSSAKRETIYPALAGFIIACSLGLSLRYASSLSNLYRWGAALGLSLGFFWITREEGPWILPSVFLLLIFGIFAVVRARQADWVKRLFAYLLPGVLCIAVVSLVEEINHHVYGEMVTVELKEPAFLAAYGALTRVKPVIVQDHVPVSVEARRRIYQVSPAFRELRQFLEGDLGKRWSSYGGQIYPDLHGEIAGGWFIWALRESVDAAGHATSGKNASRFYAQLASEVNAACDDGRLASSGPRRDSLSPPWQWRFLPPMWTAAKSAARMLADFEAVRAYLADSVGSPKAINDFARLTGRPPRLAGEVSFLNVPVHQRLRIIRFILIAYKKVGLAWTIAAVGLFVIQCAMFLTGYRSWFILAGASLLLAILMRLALLAYIDATSFQAINVVYLSPGYPMVLLFNALMTVAAAVKLRALLAHRSADSQIAAGNASPATSTTSGDTNCSPSRL